MLSARFSSGGTCTTEKFSSYEEIVGVSGTRLFGECWQTWWAIPMHKLLSVAVTSPLPVWRCSEVVGVENLQMTAVHEGKGSINGMEVQSEWELPKSSLAWATAGRTGPAGRAIYVTCRRAVCPRGFASFQSSLRKHSTIVMSFSSVEALT